MSGRRRIALLHPHHWDEVHRGTERLLQQIATRLPAAGYAPILITRSTERIPLSYAQLRRGDFDLAHAFHPSDGLAAARWSRRRARPSLFTAPAYPPWGGRLRVAVLRRMFETVTVVVAASEHLASEIRRSFPGANVVVIHPGTDLETFSPGGERAAAPTALCAAAIEEPRKRVELVVRAHALVREQLPEARLILCDPYPGRALPEWTRAPGVEVRPIRSDADLVSAYREAWVSVLAATEEPFGMVLVESLACGTPVIGARDSGIPEIVGPDVETGELFEGGSEQLAPLLEKRLRRSPEPGVAARCRGVAEGFPAAGTVAAYEALYEDLLAGSTGVTA